MAIPLGGRSNLHQPFDTMEKHILDKRRTVSVRITPYLAEYVRGKYPHDPANGGVRFPRTDDLYHCL